VMFSGYYGDSLEQVLRIATNTDEPLNITGVSSNIDDKIEYTLKNEKKDKEYTLGIKTRAALKTPSGEGLRSRRHQRRSPRFQ